MKNYKLHIFVLAAFILLSACAKKQELPPLDGADFSFSEGIDENGLWSGIRALDYVDIFDYAAMPVSADIHEISEEDIQEAVNGIMARYPVQEHITDRAVEDGDAVNIDYVGSVDAEEFAGGSTGGNGTEVTIGQTEYIDDFLEQLIGHMPGETINVEVTFPEDYGTESLNGKDALFVTTINYIAVYSEPELTDSFVSENLAAEYEWTTVSEMNSFLRDDLKKNAVTQYIYDYFASEVTVKSIPDTMIRYKEREMLNYYLQQSEYYGVGFDEFISTALGLSGVDELVETNLEQNTQTAKVFLVIQAVAEDAGISVNEADLTAYFTENTDTAGDYASYEEQFGLPYLKQYVLLDKVLNYIIDNAVMMQP